MKISKATWNWNLFKKNYQLNKRMLGNSRNPRMGGRNEAQSTELKNIANQATLNIKVENNRKTRFRKPRNALQKDLALIERGRIHRTLNISIKKIPQPTQQLPTS